MMVHTHDVGSRISFSRPTFNLDTVVSTEVGSVAMCLLSLS